MTYIRMITAKDEGLLGRIIKKWVIDESRKPLEDTFHKSPELFQGLDVASGIPKLFRILALTPDQMKELITSKKLDLEERGLESWSTSTKGLQTFADRATDKVVDGYVVIFQKVVAVKDRLVYIPSLLPIPGLEGSSEGWVEEENEVICKAQSLIWKDVKKIVFPSDSVKSKSVPLATIKYQLKLPA